MCMWLVQVQKFLVDLSKHESDALVSLDRADCFAFEKKKKKHAKTVTQYLENR